MTASRTLPNGAVNEQHSYTYAKRRRRVRESPLATACFFLTYIYLLILTTMLLPLKLAKIFPLQMPILQAMDQPVLLQQPPPSSTNKPQEEVQEESPPAPWHDHTATLPDNNVPKFVVDPLFAAEYHRIDREDVHSRCARYSLKPYDGPPRRIFYGAMVANENWEVFLMNAIETHGIFHTMVFVESNTTHMATPRTMNYYENSKEKDTLMHSGMFGNATNVEFRYWMEDMPGLLEMDRESEQRNQVIKAWKEAGMQPNDVALMADTDEVFSRDFLRAIQVCDFPELRPGQSCQYPKIVPDTISFEASPFCIKKKRWYHPDMIGGECVEGVGDPTGRVVPLRAYNRTLGERHGQWGFDGPEVFPKDILESKRFPLFNGPDIRTVPGDRGQYQHKGAPDEDDMTAAYGVAFHFHNWFTDLKEVRHKYATFAHGEPRKWDNGTFPLSQGEVPDIDILVRCAKGIDNIIVNETEWAKEYLLDGRNIKGPKPIFFLNKTYIEERHKLLQRMVMEDEALHGSAYDANGHLVPVSTAY